ncbi:Hsp70 family protein [Sphaerimonospora sp. CA-214678]|uniref:Hsp70 family protein n=1 Tax=Sphaerimonospora sp. CA-214678 TaxID=3240029 RepID=UPI003D8EBB34
MAGLQDGSLLVGEDAEILPIGQVVRSAKRAITENKRTLRAGDAELDADSVIIALLCEVEKRAKAAGRSLADAREIRLGCPAMWTGDQRERLLTLAGEADIPVSAASLIDEPIAAGVAWASHRFSRLGPRPEGKLLVFDMGGGTLDIAVLNIAGKGHPEITVLSALGIDLAGDALDKAIAEQFAAELGSHLDAFPNQDDVQAKLLNVARQTKEALSTRASFPVVFRALGDLPSIRYLREQLVEAFTPQMDIAARYILAAMRAAMLTETVPRQGRSGGYTMHTPQALRSKGWSDLAGDIDYVLLAGGMSRIPHVAERIGAHFPHAEIVDEVGVGPEQAIVAGLANTAEYQRLNLHRPSADFILEWDGGEQLLYRAHTPLYEPWEILSKSIVYYELSGRQFTCPRHGRGRLRVRSLYGETVKVKIDGMTGPVTALPFRLGDDMRFRMYPDGRILLTDGSGHHQDFRVDRWPVIRGRDFAMLELRRLTAPPPPSREDDWGYGQKDWAPPQS